MTSGSVPSHDSVNAAAQQSAGVLAAKRIIFAMVVPNDFSPVGGRADLSRTRSNRREQPSADIRPRIELQGQELHPAGQPASALMRASPVIDGFAEWHFNMLVCTK